MDANGRVYHEPGVYVFDPTDPLDPNWPPEYSLNDRLNYAARNAEASVRNRRHRAEMEQEVRRQEELRRAKNASQATEPDSFQDNPPP